MNAAQRGAACEQFTEQAFTAAAGAYMRTPGSWAQAVHAALAGLLDFVAESPFTRVAFVDELRAGAAGLERRDRALERFTDFLEPGYAQSAERLPEIVAEAVSGGVYELIRRRVAEGRIASLPAALPEATLLALAPFVGQEEAERLAARPIPLRMDR
jgi:hypothetical protein